MSYRLLRKLLFQETTMAKLHALCVFTCLTLCICLGGNAWCVNAQAEEAASAQPQWVYHSILRLYEDDRLLLESELDIDPAHAASISSSASPVVDWGAQDPLSRPTYIWIGSPEVIAALQPEQEAERLALKRAERLSLNGFEFAIYSARADRAEIEVWRADFASVPLAVDNAGVEVGSFSVELPSFDAEHPAWQRLLSYDGLLEMEGR